MFRRIHFCHHILKIMIRKRFSIYFLCTVNQWNSVGTEWDFQAVHNNCFLFCTKSFVKFSLMSFAKSIFLPTWLAPTPTSPIDCKFRYDALNKFNYSYFILGVLYLLRYLLGLLCHFFSSNFYIIRLLKTNYLFKLLDSSD